MKTPDMNAVVKDFDGEKWWKFLLGDKELIAMMIMMWSQSRRRKMRWRRRGRHSKCFPN